LRINGYFTDIERQNVKRLEVYFHNVLPFFKDSTGGVSSITSREIYCSGTLGITCASISGMNNDNSQLDVYSENKITINITNSLQSYDSNYTF